MIVLLWAATVVTASAGWGLALGHLLDRAGRGDGGDGEVDRPLAQAMALGLAAYLVLSGVLVAVNAAGSWLVTAWMVVGVAGAAWSLVRRWTMGWRPGAATSAGVLAAVGMLVLLCGHSIRNRVFNDCDDAPAYLYFVDRLLETGGLLDAFNQRRIVSFGGVTAIHALAAAPLSDSYVGFPDFVVGGTMIILLLARGPRLFAAMGAAMGAVAVVAPHAAGTQGNTTPRLIPVALLVAVSFEAHAWIRRSPTGARRGRIVVLAAEVAALMVIRPQFGLVGALIAVAAMIDLRSVAGSLRAIAHFSAILLVVLAPWSVALFRSSGTPFFPIVAGNYNKAWAGAQVGRDPAAGSTLRQIVDVLRWSDLLWAALLVIAAVAIAGRRRDRAGRVLVVAVASAVVAVVASALTLPGFELADIARYTAPAMFAAVLFGLATSLEGVPRRRGETRGAWASVVLGISAVVLASGLDASMVSRAVRDAAGGAVDVALTAPEPEQEPREGRWYRAISEALPRGSHVLAGVDRPGDLDLGRLHVVTIDVAGSVSPPPHLLLHGSSPSDILASLLDRGIEYVVAVDPARSRCLYNRARWEETSARTTGPHRFWAPDMLAWMAFTEAARDAAASGAVTTAGPVFAVDLREVDVDAFPASGLRAAESRPTAPRVPV